MLWDPERQDGETLAFYKKLLSLRRQEPALLRGNIVDSQVSDPEGLMLIIRELENRSLALVFHGKEGTVSLPDFEGYTDLITGSRFDGTLEGIGALVLAE
jgi:glycosidase